MFKHPLSLALAALLSTATVIPVAGYAEPLITAEEAALPSRIKPFALATGIDMPDAQVPPGEHLVRVDVKDSVQLLAEGSTVATVQHDIILLK